MIIKVRNKAGFAQIQNTTLRDRRLSLDARGALGEILTYSEDFKVDTESLMKMFGIGREKLLKITTQLKEFGYLEIRPVRDERGKIVDKDWIFYGESQGVDFRRSAEEVSKNAVSIQDAGNPYDGRAQDTGLPYVGENQSTENPHDLNRNTNSSQKEENKDLKINPPSPRAALREIPVDEIFEPDKTESDELPEEYSPTLAIEIYREIYPTVFLDKETLEDFARRLPEVEESVWRQNVLDWKLSRWGRNNIPGMIERYFKQLKKWKKEQEELEFAGENLNAGIQKNGTKYKNSKLERDRYAIAEFQALERNRKEVEQRRLELLREGNADGG